MMSWSGLTMNVGGPYTGQNGDQCQFNSSEQHGSHMQRNNAVGHARCQSCRKGQGQTKKMLVWELFGPKTLLLRFRLTF